MEFLIFLGAVLIIVINWYLGEQFYAAANAKGHSSRKYFWISFLIPTAGYLLVIALPDRLDSPQVVADELPEL